MRRTPAEINAELAKIKGRGGFVNFSSRGNAASREMFLDLQTFANSRGDIPVVNIDISECPNAFEIYNIASFPTVFVFDKNGKIVRFIREYKSTEELDLLLSRITV